MQRQLLADARHLAVLHIAQARLKRLDVARRLHTEAFEHKFGLRIDVTRAAGYVFSAGQSALEVRVADCRANGIRVRIAVSDNKNWVHALMLLYVIRMAPLRNPFDGMKPCGLIVSFNRGNRKVWKRNPTQNHLRLHCVSDGADRTDSAAAPKILPKSASPSAHLPFEKPKIAAVTAAAQRFCARKAELVQSAVGHVIHVAKTADTAPDSRFLACRVPETLGNRRGKVRFVVFLCALPQVGGTHDFEKTIAVNPMKNPGTDYFFTVKACFFCRHQSIMYVPCA